MIKSYVEDRHLNAINKQCSKAIENHIFKNQVRHKGIWGTVCKEYFSEDEAKVFCRFLVL